MANQASPTQKLNILVLGRSGVGKSTLINAILRSDRAATGIGKPITNKIKRYSKSGFGIYDTPGLEDGEKQFNFVRKCVSKLIKEKKQQEPHEHIHAIWYCFNYHQPKYLDSDLKWIKELGKNLPIVIVFTKVSEPSCSEFMEEFMANLEDEEVSPHVAVPVLAKSIGQNAPYGVDLLEKVTLQLSERTKNKSINDRVEELGKKAFLYSIARISECSSLMISASVIPTMHLVPPVLLKSGALQTAQALLLSKISRMFDLPVGDEIQGIVAVALTSEFFFQVTDGNTMDDFLQNLLATDIFDRLTQALPDLANALTDNVPLLSTLLRGGKLAFSTLLMSIAYIEILKSYKIRAYQGEDISQYSLVDDFRCKYKEVIEQFIKPNFGF